MKHIFCTLLFAALLFALPAFAAAPAAVNATEAAPAVQPPAQNATVAAPPAMQAPIWNSTAAAPPPAVASQDAAKTAVPLDPDKLFTMEYQVCLEDPVNAAATAIKQCHAAEHKRQDERLNAVYKTLMGSGSFLDVKEKQLLRGAQRAWLAFRDANGAFLRSTRDDTISGLVHSGSLTEMTARRAKELEGLFMQGYTWRR